MLKNAVHKPIMKREKKNNTVIYKQAQYADVTHIDNWTGNKIYFQWKRNVNKNKNNNHNTFKYIYKTKEKRHKQAEKNTKLNIIK